MNRPCFEPWVGENYESGGIFCKKILVLGDSHYCSGSKNCEGRGVAMGVSCIPDFTKKVVIKNLSAPSLSSPYLIRGKLLYLPSQDAPTPTSFNYYNPDSEVIRNF